MVCNGLQVLSEVGATWTAEGISPECACHLHVYNSEHHLHQSSSIFPTLFQWKVQTRWKHAGFQNPKAWHQSPKLCASHGFRNWIRHRNRQLIGKKSSHSTNLDADTALSALSIRIHRMSTVENHELRSKGVFSGVKLTLSYTVAPHV